MARLRDTKTVILEVGFGKFIWRIYQRMSKNNLLVWASALAYSWLFSLFPFLIFVLTLMPYMPARVTNGAEHGLHVAINELPPSASETVWESVRPSVRRILHEPPRGLLSTGLIIMLWAASSGMSITMQAMDRCWGAVQCRPYYRQRLLAIFLTIIEAALIIGVLILLPIGTLVTRWAMANVQQISHFLSTSGTGPAFLVGHAAVVYMTWQFVRIAVALILMLSATALIYHFGPSESRPFHWITPGSVFTIAVWLILGELFRIYVTHFGKGYQMYGAVGGVAILLLFFYIDAAVLLLGAEINSEIENVAGGIKTPEVLGPAAETIATGEFRGL